MIIKKSLEKPKIELLQLFQVYTDEFLYLTTVEVGDNQLELDL